MKQQNQISIKNELIKENASEQQSVDECSSQNFGSFLKKRARPTSYSELNKIVNDAQGESQSDNNTQQPTSEQEKRQRRLLQNRLSAKKCRQKKKQEFNGMQYDVENLIADNKLLKEKINDITMMLYQKIDENALIQRKLDQAVMQNTVILSQLLNVPQSAASPKQQSSNIGQVMASPVVATAAPNSNLLGNLNGFQKMGTAATQNGTQQQSQILSLLSSLQGGSDAQKKQPSQTASPQMIPVRTGSAKLYNQAGVTQIPVQVIQQNSQPKEAYSPKQLSVKAGRNFSGSGDQLSVSTNADQNLQVKF